MPIVFACDCGASYRIKDELAGRRFACKKCGAALAVPSAASDPPGDPSPGSSVTVLASPPPGARLRGRGIARELGALALFLAKAAGVVFLLTLALSLHRSWKVNNPPQVVYVPVPVAAPSERDDPPAIDAPAVTQPRAKSEEETRAEEEAKEARIRSAMKLVNGALETVESAELVPGRRYAFLHILSSGDYFTTLVEDGQAKEFATADRYRWETDSPEDLACEWARRKRDGSYRAKSARKGPWSLSAVVIDEATAMRYRVEMNGFDPTGEAEVAMTPLDQ